MGKIYNTQTDVTIRLNTGRNISSGSLSKIGYRTPSGDIGEWDAEIENPEEGIIYYNILSPLIAGKWTIWAKIQNPQDLISVGEPSSFDIFNEGY